MASSQRRPKLVEVEKVEVEESQETESEEVKKDESEQKGKVQLNLFEQVMQLVSLTNKICMYFGTFSVEICNMV